MLLIAVKRSRAEGAETPGSNISKQRRSRLLLFPGSEETCLQDVSVKEKSSKLQQVLQIKVTKPRSIQKPGAIRSVSALGRQAQSVHNCFAEQRERCRSEERLFSISLAMTS